MLISGGGGGFTQALLQGKQIGNQARALREQAHQRRQQLALGIGGLGLGALNLGGDIYGTVAGLSEAEARRKQSGEQVTAELAQRKELFGQGLVQREKESLRETQAAQSSRNLQAKLAELGVQERTGRDAWLAQRGRDQDAMSLLADKMAERRKETAALEAKHAAMIGRPIVAAQTLKENIDAGKALGRIENEQLATQLGIRGAEAEKLAKAGHWRNMETQAAQDEAAAERQKSALDRTAPNVRDAQGNLYPWPLAQAILEQQNQEANRALQRQMPGISSAANMKTAAGINDLPLGPADRTKLGLQHWYSSDLQREGAAQDINKLRVSNEYAPPAWEKSPDFPAEMNTRRVDILNQLRSGLIDQSEASRQLGELSKSGSMGYIPEEMSARNAGATTPTNLQDTESYLAALEAAIANSPEPQQQEALREVVRRRMLGGGGPSPAFELPGVFGQSIEAPGVIERNNRLRAILSKIGY